jgi:hypothetical protein
VNAVNDAPAFTLAGNPPDVNESSGAQTVNNFATNISAGPANESTQTLSFNVTSTGTTGSLAFAVAPAIDSSGNLTYTLVDGTSGTATFSVTLSDDGSGTAPNVNTSGEQTFTITVLATGNPEGESFALSPTDAALLAYLSSDDSLAVSDSAWQAAVDQAMAELG